MKPRLSNLKNYIEQTFKSTARIDYVDLFLNDRFEGQFEASLALNGKYLALDSKSKRRSVKSYCFPLSSIIEREGNTLNFNYCGSEFLLTFFRANETAKSTLDRKKNF